MAIYSLFVMGKAFYKITFPLRGFVDYLIMAVQIWPKHVVVY
jgi:hypothetical protein